MENRDLELLLASCIHDMKNSLTLILNSVSELGPANKGSEHLANLRYEASRLNNDLMHLLGVYRIKEQELPIVIDEHEVEDVLAHQVLKNELLLKKYNVSLDASYEPDLFWHFDDELIGGIINNIIVNAVRYTDSTIRIESKIIDSFLCITISDDGEGYPENMLLHPEKPNAGINFRSGSTSLGIYFSAKVARMHKRAEHRGYIVLENGGKLGGGVFSIFIP